MKNFNYRKLVLALSDIFIIVIGTLITNFFFSLVAPAYVQGAKGLGYIIIADIIMCVLVQFAFGCYSKLWRFFKLRDYAVCAAAMFIGELFSIVMFVVFGKQFSKLFFLTNYIITTFGVLSFRFLFRKSFLVLTDAGAHDRCKRTLVVGAGQAANLILTELEGAQYDANNPWHGLEVVGMVDDDISKINTRVHGKKVLGSTNDIPDLCASFVVDLIIFAIPSCSEEDRVRILEICSKTGCEIKVIPYLANLIFDSEHSGLISQATDIRLEDLLGREPIEFDKSNIREYIAGKVCLVTGGGGSIGSELVRQIARYSPKKIIILDIYENNAYEVQQEVLMEYGDTVDLVTLICSVRDYDKMEAVFKEYRPDLVFHAAAHKHVPLMETVPEEAVKNNVFGTFNVATLAKLYKADKFVMISTDKAVNPTNVMGCTKRVCEMIIEYMAQNSDHTEFVTTRFGNVLGSNGSVIPLFRKQIESGKPVTVTHPDVIRYFMTIPEAVSLVLEAGAMAHGGEIFVLDMGKPVKIVTLAENLIRMYGKVPYDEIEIKFTGLRPGEKLFEELLMDEEGLKQTANKKIFIGNQLKIDPSVLLTQLDELKKLAEANQSGEVVELLTVMVPTFNHKP